MRDTCTYDWVERETGERYDHLCALYGHDKEQVSEAKDVQGHPAAHFTCTRCGQRFFHWVGEPRLVR